MAAFSAADIKANPVLGCPEALAALAELGAKEKEALRKCLFALQAAARAQEANAIRRRKGPMIQYWMAFGTYFGHLARAIRRA